MVSEVPSFEEFFGLNKDDLTEDDFDYKSSDKNEEYMGIAILMIFFNFYRKYQYKPISYVENNFEKDLSQLKANLDKTLDKESFNILDKYKISTLDKDNIPAIFKDKITWDFNYKEPLKVAKSTIAATINQLKDDIKTKILVYKDVAKKAVDFNIKPNIKRATRRFKDTVNFNAQSIKQKVTRGYQKFKYGEDMLYTWVVSGRNTCNGCYTLASYPPQTIEKWPLDHPRGACELKPVDPSLVSNDYLKLVEEATLYSPVAQLAI